MDKAETLLDSIGPFVVSADVQTHGHGRMERVWDSPSGGAWFTIAVRKRLKAPQILSFCASLAVLDVSPNNVYPKWPNDVYYDGKKLSGVLLKLVGCDVLVGIGINVNNISKERSVSIKEIVGEERVVRSIISSCVDRFMHYMDVFEKEGTAAILQMWKKRCPYIGKEVQVNTITGMKKGVFVDLDANGFMVLESGGQRNIIREGDLV